MEAIKPGCTVRSGSQVVLSPKSCLRDTTESIFWCSLNPFPLFLDPAGSSSQAYGTGGRHLASERPGKDSEPSWNVSQSCVWLSRVLGNMHPWAPALGIAVWFMELVSTHLKINKLYIYIHTHAYICTYIYKISTATIKTLLQIIWGK